MVKSVIGTSGNQNPEEAVREACASIKNPQALIVFTENGKLRQQAAMLARLYPGVPCIGTSGDSFCNGKSVGKSLVITAFTEGIAAAAGVMEHASTMPLVSVEGVRKNLDAVKASASNTVCIEFCTGAEEKLITTLQAGIAGRGVSVVGGTVFGYPQGESPLVSVNGTIYEDACAYLFVRSLSGKVRTYRENIYQPAGYKPHIATKVDRRTRALIELDGRPAAEVYTQETKIPREKIVDSVLQCPMGRVVGSDVYIASMHTVDAKGALINYKQVNENDTIEFLKLADYPAVMEETRQKIQAEIPKPSLILSVDCIYRYLLFQNIHYLETYLTAMRAMGPHVGIVGGGEQYNNQHVNQTMVCVVFE